MLLSRSCPTAVLFPSSDSLSDSVSVSFLLSCFTSFPSICNTFDLKRSPRLHDESEHLALCRLFHPFALLRRNPHSLSINHRRCDGKIKQTQPVPGCQYSSMLGKREPSTTDSVLDVNNFLVRERDHLSLKQDFPFKRSISTLILSISNSFCSFAFCVDVSYVVDC